MVFGEKCVDLIKEAKRESSMLIAPYNKKLVDEVMQEMATISRTLYESLSAEMAQDGQPERSMDETGHGSITMEPTDRTLEYRNRLLVNKIYLRSFLWNKRCLLAYHRFRLERLKQMRWELGTVLPAEVKANISEDELRWFLNYSKNLSDYMSGLNDNRGIDLTLFKNPPKRHYIQVRCTVDYGPLELDDGATVMLTKDSMHYLPMTKCEKLIHQGVLEHIQ